MTCCIRCVKCGRVIRSTDKPNVPGKKPRKLRRDDSFQWSRESFICCDCGSESAFEFKAVECRHCNGYVPFGTKICECGCRRILTRAEAMAAGIDVHKGDLDFTRQVSSAGRKKDALAGTIASNGMVIAYRMTDREYDEHE